MSESEQRPRVLYTAEATVKGGRRGHGVTSDGVVEVERAAGDLVTGATDDEGAAIGRSPS